MEKNQPPVIEGEFTVVGEPPVREPIIKSWPALWWFIIPPVAIGFVRYCQLKGWL